MLDKLLGFTADTLKGALHIEKVWTNPNPSASFGAQSVLVDLTGFNAVAVVFKPLLNENSTAVSMALVGGGGYLNFSDKTNMGRRYYQVYDSSVAFGDGRYAGVDGGDYEIPLEIYGLKVVGGGSKLTRFFRRVRKAVGR